MKQSSGNSSTNIQAARDIIISLKDISQYLSKDIPSAIEESLLNVDKKVNELFPEGVESLKSKDKNQPFNSSKIISSLGLIGIPIDVSFLVLEKTVNKIELYKTDSDTLDALKIRQFVANSIMTIETHNHSASKIQIWADYYIRRYGDPNHRIEIIMPDGNNEFLEQKFVENHLLRDLVNNILTQTDYLKFQNEISNTEIRAMAREIVEIITSLNIYRIHYDTFFRIAKEHALQPPHPWFVIRPFDYLSVKYDYDKVQFHLAKLDFFEKSNDFGAILFCIREIIHHSCSAILSYYGVFIGCGEFAALNNLYNLLIKISESNYYFESSYTKVDILITDISKNYIDLYEMIKCLKDIKRRVSYSINTEPSNIETYITLTRQLANKYVFILLSKYIELNSLKEKFNLSDMKESNLIDIVKTSIHILPFFQLGDENHNYFWISQSLKGGVFELIRHQILIYCTFSNNDENHTVEIDIASKLVNQMHHVSNSFIVISNRDVSNSDKIMLKKLFNDGVFAAVISIEKFIDITTDKSPDSQLRNMIKIK